MACGILVPWPGIQAESPTLEGRFLTPGSLGKPLGWGFPKGMLVVVFNLAVCQLWRVRCWNLQWKLLDCLSCLFMLSFSLCGLELSCVFVCAVTYSCVLTLCRKRPFSINIPCLHICLVWYQGSHSNSLVLSVCRICLSSSFSFHPLCVFNVKLPSLWCPSVPSLVTWALAMGQVSPLGCPCCPLIITFLSWGVLCTDPLLLCQLLENLWMVVLAGKSCLLWHLPCGDFLFP